MVRPGAAHKEHGPFAVHLAFASSRTASTAGISRAMTSSTLAVSLGFSK